MLVYAGLSLLDNVWVHTNLLGSDWRSSCLLHHSGCSTHAPACIGFIDDHAIKNHVRPACIACKWMSREGSLRRSIDQSGRGIWSPRP